MEIKVYFQKKFSDFLFKLIYENQTGKERDGQFYREKERCADN